MSTPLNCQYSNWSDWSICNNFGYQSRYRTIIAPNNNEGQACSNIASDYTEIRRCPINCQYNDWSNWSMCNINGIQTRNRTIMQPEYNGVICSTNANDYIERRTCQTECTMNPWTFNSENNNNISLERTCSCPNAPCSLLPNDRTKTIQMNPWTYSSEANNNITMTRNCNNINECTIIPDDRKTRVVSMNPWTYSSFDNNNNMILSRTCTDMSNNCIVPNINKNRQVENAYSKYINKFLLVKDLRNGRYFQSGRLSGNDVLDYHVNRLNSPNILPDGQINVIPVPNEYGVVYLKIGEFLTIKNNKAAKTNTLDNFCKWRIFEDENNKIYINNVNYENGSYFLYSNGDGTASLDIYSSSNVITNGVYIIEAIMSINNPLFMNKYLLLKSTRDNRYLQVGRLSSNDVLDYYFNRNNSLNIIRDGQVNVIPIPNDPNSVYLKIGEYLTIKNNKAGKTANLDNFCKWRVYQDSSNNIFLNNVNFNNGMYFLYSNGDGTASLDLYNSPNVINYGKFTLELLL